MSDIFNLYAQADCPLGDLNQDNAQRWAAREITRLQSEVEGLRGRCGEVEDVCAKVHRDLLLRAEPDWDDKNAKVVNLSAGYWEDLCRVVDSARRLRQQAAESAGGERE